MLSLTFLHALEDLLGLFVVCQRIRKRDQSLRWDIPPRHDLFWLVIIEVRLRNVAIRYYCDRIRPVFQLGEQRFGRVL